MNAQARSRRLRILMAPVSPQTGEPRPDAPTVVYTVPRHRFWPLWKHLCRLNGGKWPVVTSEGFYRYLAHVMEEDYYQQHKPDGWVVHRARADRIIEQEHRKRNSVLV